MQWRIYDESVEMISQRHQFFPQTFRWRGHHFDVQAVEHCWTTSWAPWRRRRVERRFFEVSCACGTFELFQDLQTGTWHLRRARLLSPKRPVMRQTLPGWWQPARWHLASGGQHGNRATLV